MSEPASPMRLGITMGDPGGIGPEVVLKGLAAATGFDEVVVYGDSEVLEYERRNLVGGGNVDLEGVRPGTSGIEYRDVAPEIEWNDRPVGPTGRSGAVVQKRALRRAMEDADDGEIDAIVTAPWNKSLFSAIDEPVVGHTEMLAEFYGVDDVVMMLGGDRLRVALVTTHIAVDEVSGALSGDDIETTAEIVARALTERYGIDAPRIAVCGLNPHAGEQGHMGREEIEIIEPAVERLAEWWSQRSASIEGPFPADTLFAGFRDGAPFDAVVCMYHDQGLIPLKLLHFGASANVTLGLPIVRTSVDHGTAYDIAGDGVADPGSMIYALELAAETAGRMRGDESGAGGRGDAP